MEAGVRTPFSSSVAITSSRFSGTCASGSVAASPPSSSWCSVEVDKEDSIGVPFLHLWLQPLVAQDTQSLPPHPPSSPVAAAAAANISTSMVNTSHAAMHIEKKRMPAATSSDPARGLGGSGSDGGIGASGGHGNVSFSNTALLFDADSAAEEHHCECSTVAPTRYSSSPADAVRILISASSASDDPDVPQSFPSFQGFPSHATAPSHNAPTQLSSRCDDTATHLSPSLTLSSSSSSSPLAAPLRRSLQSDTTAPAPPPPGVAALVYEAASSRRVVRGDGEVGVNMGRRFPSLGHPLEDAAVATRIATATLNAAAPNTVSNNTTPVTSTSDAGRLSLGLHDSFATPTLRVNTAELHWDATTTTTTATSLGGVPLQVARVTESSGAFSSIRNETVLARAVNHRDACAATAAAAGASAAAFTVSGTCMHFAAMVEAGVTLRSCSRSQSRYSSLSADPEEFLGDDGVANAPTPMLLTPNEAERPFTTTGPEDFAALSTCSEDGPFSKNNQHLHHTQVNEGGVRMRSLYTAITPANEGPAATTAPRPPRRKAPSRLSVPPTATPLMSLRYCPRTREEESELEELQSRLAAFVFPPQSPQAHTTNSPYLPPGGKSVKGGVKWRSPRAPVVSVPRTNANATSSTRGSRGNGGAWEERREGSKGATGSRISRGGAKSESAFPAFCPPWI